MSTLTKVFVVLLCIFSIAFTSMTVATVARTTHWRDTALKYEEHARVADTNLRHEIAANAALLATAREEVRSLSNSIGGLESQLATARSEAAQYRAQLAKVEAEKSSAEAMNRGLFSQLQVADSARGEYRKQRDGMETTNVDLSRRNIDLNDRVNELTARVDVLLEQKRQAEQQINMLQAAAGRPMTFESVEGVAMQGVEALTPVASRKISGQVSEVSGNMVMISVGSADGVKKDMVFVVHRDGEYVADIQVDLVDPSQSAGRLVRSSGMPQAGDTVTDAQSMGRRASR